MGLILNKYDWTVTIFILGYSIQTRTEVPKDLVQVLTFEEFKANTCGFTWAPMIFSKGEKAQKFYLDFRSKPSYIGIRSYGSDWGINNCSKDLGCKPGKPAYITLGRRRFTAYKNSKIALKLFKNQVLNEDQKMQIHLLTTKSNESPNASPVASLGMGPNSDFFNYLRTAFKWPIDAVTLNITIKSNSNTTKGIVASQKDEFTNSTITFNIDHNKFANSTKLDTSTSEWKIPSVTITSPKSFKRITGTAVLDFSNRYLITVNKDFKQFYDAHIKINNIRM